MITHYFQKTLLAVSDRIRLLQNNNNQANKAFRSLDMFEIGLTTLILLFFIFPIPGLAISLGVWTCYLVYGKLLLLNRQPSRWKKIVWIYFLTRAADIILSFLMGAMLAFTVYFLIFDGLRLFVFNLIFCFLISFRWFDFTHVIYRRLVFKLQPISLPAPKNSAFCMLVGQRSGTGIGIGMKSVSLDSGYAYWSGRELIFDGVMARKVFSRNSVLSVEKISSEKIKITPTRQKSNEKSEVWTLIIRQQFYPFRTRELRDQWFQQLSGLQDFKTQGFQLDDGLESSQIPSA